MLNRLSAKQYIDVCIISTYCIYSKYIIPSFARVQHFGKKLLLLEKLVFQKFCIKKYRKFFDGFCDQNKTIILFFNATELPPVSLRETSWFFFVHTIGMCLFFVYLHRLTFMNYFFIINIHIFPQWFCVETRVFPMTFINTIKIKPVIVNPDDDQHSGGRNV